MPKHCLLTESELPTGQVLPALRTGHGHSHAGPDLGLAAGYAGVDLRFADDLELVAGKHHELVAGHVGGLGVLSLGHGDGLELVAGHTGDSWCHRAVVGAIGR